MLKRWLPHQLGHFYSPVGDIDALALERGRLWPRDAICPGIDFEPAAKSLLLREVFPAQLSGFDYPARADNDDHAYRLQNSQFGEADARALFALLRHWQPQRLIEVRSEEHTSELPSLMRTS